METYCNNNIAPWMKKRNKHLKDTQLAFVKATAALVQVSDNLLKAE